MRLPELAIKNNQFIYVIVGLILFMGVRSFISMPKSEDPSLDLPNYTVVAIYPGASPKDMEELVVDPIEEAVDELDEITEIRTEIANGLAVIQIEAEFGIDYDDKFDEILAEINGVRDHLPDDLYDLEVTQFKPEERVVIHQYAIASDAASFKSLYGVAEDLQDEIEKLDFVKKAEIEAHPTEEIRVSLDFQKMANLNIPLSQVLGVLKGNNVNIPGGDVKAGGLSLNIQSTGSYNDIEEIAETRLLAAGGDILYLKDIAEVSHAYQDRQWIARFNKKRAIYLSVYQKRDANILTLSGQLKRVTDDFKAELPPSISIETAFEQAPAVRARINDFISNLLQGIVLVGLIIGLFLGWRPALIVMTVIPLSIVIAITVLDFTGYALQQISIAALVIALGLLVDNAIVVIENIARYRKEGYSILEAAAKGTREVGLAILSSTVTTILAFAPLALLESGPGEYLRSLPLTVIYALSASLLLALAFTPIISGKILKKKASQDTWLANHTRKLIDRIYRPTLKFALKKGWVIIIAGVLLLGGAVSLFPSIGVSFFPTADKSLLLISVDLPYSANVDRTDKAIRYIEDILDTTAYVHSYTTNAGHGNPQVYYNRIPEEFKKYHGEVLVNFKSWDPKKFYATLASFRQAFSQYPDARIYFRELKNGAPFEAPIEILLLGDRLDTLKRIAADIEKLVRSAPGTRDTDNPMALDKTDISIEIDRDRAALYGVSLLEADQTVRASLNGLQVDEVTLDEDDETYPLTVRIPFSGQPSIQDLDKVYIANRMGEQVPLKQIADLAFKGEYAKISHFNLTRSIGVTANVANPDITKAITERIIPKLEDYRWPKGCSYYIGGEYETQQQSFGDLGILLAVALLGIFAVLVLQFRSLMQPLIIFSAIPMAITGSFVALYLTGWSFSFFAFVGFISLVGIVVNNSIILVDYTNQLVREGMDKTSAIRQAAERRFTPIMLTTLTTILGLIPLTFSGTSLWSPLGWTLIGGLLSSMLLTLVIVPILYNWLTRSSKIKQLQES